MATMVDSDAPPEDAALIVDVCFSVEEGDVVTIICDDERRRGSRRRRRLRRARRVAGGHEQRAQVRRGRADVRFPMAPPANLHRAMVGSDEVIIIANLEWANRFAHVSAVRETCEANGKIASIEPGMGGGRARISSGPRSGRRTRWRPWREEARARDDGARHRLHVSIEGREPLCLTPYKARGQMMSPIPLWTEVAFAAIEDFTHGTPSSTASCSASASRARSRSRSLDARGRPCVEIEGGEEAERLRKAIDGVENVDVIGEFAFGTSEKAPFGTPSEKGRIGTVHLARRQPQRVPRRAERLRAPPRRRLPRRDDVDRARAA